MWEGSWHNSLQRGLLESKTLTATMGLDEEGGIRQEQQYILWGAKQIGALTGRRVPPFKAGEELC